MFSAFSQKGLNQSHRFSHLSSQYLKISQYFKLASHFWGHPPRRPAIASAQLTWNDHLKENPNESVIKDEAHSRLAPGLIGHYHLHYRHGTTTRRLKTTWRREWDWLSTIPNLTWANQIPCTIRLPSSGYWTEHSLSSMLKIVRMPLKHNALLDHD